MRTPPSGTCCRGSSPRTPPEGAPPAWLTLAALAHNLTRALGALATAFHARARTGTIRRHLIAVPARLAVRGRTLTFHLPGRRPWQDAFEALWTAVGCRLRT
ncbi:hypothetical protein WJ438_28585 [Streptomyces sp. GD-15H]|uniref:hypothetical protein n=1 Tax=Streptomyces sp. GD-15H TaxID=3129112 RepID=UPI00324EA063